MHSAALDGLPQGFRRCWPGQKRGRPALEGALEIRARRRLRYDDDACVWRGLADAPQDEEIAGSERARDHEERPDGSVLKERKHRVELRTAVGGVALPSQ